MDSIRVILHKNVKIWNEFLLCNYNRCWIMQRIDELPDFTRLQATDKSAIIQQLFHSSSVKSMEITLSNLSQVESDFWCWNIIHVIQ